MLSVRTPLLTRPAAVILAACSLLSMVVILHHPVVHARRPQEALAGMMRLTPADRTVHAILLVLILLMVYAVSVLTYANRGRLLLGVGGLAIFSIGAGAVIGAGMIDGFFTPLFAARYGVLAPSLQNYAVPVLTASAIGIQILTKFGFFAFSGAAVLWGVEIFQAGGRNRLAGALACAAAVAEFAFVLSAGTLNPHNLSTMALLQAVWCLAFAWVLWNEPESASL
ncbi:MAG TPA: hypothetical protein VFE17_04905 [Candidatus Baltobacteraceae bacterium]|nr:hypothetical protein [Candidatus Baltobacteraceae bacterium]